MKREIPFDVPADTTVELECILETRQAGPFESQVHLFVDDLGTRELVVTVHGAAKPPLP